MRAVRAWAGAEAVAVAGADREVREVREGMLRRDASEVLGVARCPRCGAELVPSLGRAGPYFACRCRRKC